MSIYGINALELERMMNFEHDETVRVFRQERYDGEWMPEKLTEAVAWLQEKMAAIPEQYRESATIEIDSVGSYEDSHYAAISIEYRRPPTAEEVEARKNTARRRAEESLAWAKRKLAEEEKNIAAMR